MFDAYGGWAPFMLIGVLNAVVVFFAIILRIVAPGGMPADAQNALAEAIASVVTDPDAKVTKIINKVFGGAVTIKGAELDTYLQNGFAGAADLMKAVGN